MAQDFSDFSTDTESYVGDDPSGAGDTGVGYGSTTMDTGGGDTDSTVLSQAGFNEAKGITALNPFGEDNFFTRAFGIDPRSLDYSGLGIDLGGTADLAYDRYLNPLVSRKDGTFSLRPGLSAGEKTRLGEIIEVDRPMSGMDQLARTVFGLGTPIGMFTSALGTTEKAIAPNETLLGGLNYDPRLDPNSPQYVGPQSILGKAASGLESLLTGGAKPISRFFQEDKDKPTAIDQLQSQRSFFDPSKKEFIESNLSGTKEDFQRFVTDMPSATGRGSQGIVRTNVAPFDSDEQNEIDRVMNVVSTDTSKPREKVVGTPVNLAGMLGDQKFDLSGQAGRDEYFNFIRRLNPSTFS